MAALQTQLYFGGCQWVVVGHSVRTRIWWFEILSHVLSCRTFVLSHVMSCRMLCLVACYVLSTLGLLVGLLLAGPSAGRCRNFVLGALYVYITWSMWRRRNI